MGPGHIPYCVPYQSPQERQYLLEAIGAGVSSGSGAFSQRSRRLMSKIAGGGEVFLTTSGSAALELATLIAGVGVGDEVIVPSFTFTSVANAVVLRGATPVFVDIEFPSLNIDPDRLEAAITERTRAVIVVHYAGVICDMAGIVAIARRRGIMVIEDAAHAIGSTRDGRPAGSFGDLAAFSFHYTKNVTCGEGGCLVVNQPALVPKAEIAFEKGTNRRAFFQGAVDKYSWIEVGSSFILSELNAAMLTAQLEQLTDITAMRLDQWHTYHDHCSHITGEPFSVPSVASGNNHNAHSFHLILASETARHDFIATMRAQGITTPFHYVPLHSSPAGQRLGRTAGPMPVTDLVWGRLVRLPLYPSLGDDIHLVTAAISAWTELK